MVTVVVKYMYVHTSYVAVCTTIYYRTLYIGMDEVFQHHAHIFEKSNLNFQFQCEFSCHRRMVAMGNIHVYLKNCITNNGDNKKRIFPIFLLILLGSV